MLSRLTVENYALIDRLELVLDPHLNIVTGETGAGKSILLGALGLLLGAKNESAAAKDATRNCVVEGVFDVAGLGLESLFDEYELDYEPVTVIRRVITPAGKSRSFVNDVPVQLTQLRDLGAHLVDIHSQHQNLIVSSPVFRMRATDTMASNGELLDEYRAAFENYKSSSRELSKLRAEAAKAREDEEWIRFQVEELAGANLRTGEVAELEEEQAMLSSADTIGETLGSALAALNDEENGILPRLKGIEQGLHRIGESYRPSTELAERIHSAMLEIKDIEYTLSGDAESIEADPARLEAVDARLATIWSLCRKHRVESVDELIALRDDYKSRLDALTFGDERISALEEEVDIARRRAEVLAGKLHDRRSRVVKEFAAEIVARLARLGMPEAMFEVELQPTDELTDDGRDEAVFMFTANSRMPLRPIEKIASGGEMSRMMLSLKSLLASRMNLPMIVFDEIDTGVSGRIADAMGEIIVELAESMQVMNITHLPQVASKGEAHFVVYKEDSRSNIRRLTDEERVTEIAKMLSGSEITDAAILQAKNLLK